jgi:RHS repeat-associated protein
VNVTGTAKTPAYDLNGNTLTDGAGKSYVWDAENRLTKIIYADNSSTEFQYNGISQRVRVIEKSSANAITSDKRYLWAGGNQPSEERDSSGTTVIKRYFPQGEQIPAAAAPLNKLFYSKDHLGNIRELTDSNGALQTRYDYDMWGKRVKLSGTLETEVGYTGHHHHAKSELILTWFRAYDAEMGRWLSADPLESVTGEMAEMLPEGSNLYTYVGNDSVNYSDPSGLGKVGLCKRVGQWGIKKLGLNLPRSEVKRIFIKEGGDVYASKSQLKKWASQKHQTKGKKYVVEKHGDGAEHIHRGDRTRHGGGKGGHGFISSILTLTGLFGSNWFTSGVDFLNPLSDVGDLLDWGAAEKKTQDLINDKTSANGAFCPRA